MQRNSVDKSIPADVSVIRYEFETNKVKKMILVPGRLHLADPGLSGTIPDSPLRQDLQLLMHDGIFPFSFNEAETRSSDRSLG